METIIYELNAVWIYLAAMLVIFMQAGFALLEAGSTQMKNAGHVAGKQVLSFAIGAIVFWAFGYGITFGEGNGFFGTQGWFLKGFEGFATGLTSGDLPVELTYLFQYGFAAVSLAIAWGGFAERAKLSVYFVFGTLFMIVIYPAIGHWVWGGGWLGELGMLDFAGSTVVHLTGAIAALIATLLLGPRLGKYNKNGKPNAIPGHNQVYTVLGTLILWLGWFGFNPGSTLQTGAAQFTYVALTTNLAAAAGAIFALLAAKLHSGKADIPATLNGVLAALVAITAPSAFVEPWAAVVIGGAAGFITYFTAVYFERKKVDDPVCAFSVHGIAGIWGTISIGLFGVAELTGGSAGLFYGGGLKLLGIQTLGVVAAGLYVAVITFVILGIMKVTMGIRVSEEYEVAGLDISEHGSYGYPELLKKSEEKKNLHLSAESSSV
ncbi:ammonium transporter [Microaerobacter geothermalis]|uniref:ammonium transporter n=1 Tax=Microaerobacter geothermalis TaxID=674972 RepID=UPI001F1B6F20|nr:ammonium transporter [Microaerobacter geothermalis]MCF6093965.1 ammonium transporter [Microaerobacter geothermalis]